MMSVLLRTFSATLLLALSASSCLASAPLDASQEQAGQQLFAGSGCEHCHGVGAKGGDVGPSLLGIGKRLKPEEITAKVHDGNKVMPAFGDILTADQIAQLVAYLQTLPAPSKPRHGKH